MQILAERRNSMGFCQLILPLPLASLFDRKPRPHIFLPQGWNFTWNFVRKLVLIPGSKGFRPICAGATGFRQRR